MSPTGLHTMSTLENITLLGVFFVMAVICILKDSLSLTAETCQKGLLVWDRVRVRGTAIPSNDYLLVVHSCKSCGLVFGSK